MTLTTLIANYRAAKEAADAATADADRLNAIAKKLQQDLYEHMSSEDVSSIKHGDTLYVRASTVYGQVQDERAFRKWCEDNDAEEFFEPKPRKKLINELVRERVNASQPLPDGVGMYEQEYISQRGRT